MVLTLMAVDLCQSSVMQQVQHTQLIRRQLEYRLLYEETGDVRFSSTWNLAS